MILLNDFKLKQVAKSSSKINKSPFVPLDKFDLPTNTCIHYISDMSSQIGMRGSNPLIRTWSANGSIGLYPVSELSEVKHRARVTNISKAAISKYFQSQTLFSKVTKLDRVIGRERQLLVMDYSALSASIVIASGINQFYHTYDNIAGTIIGNITESTSSRLNIIQLRLPEVLPERSVFNKADGDTFDSDEAQLWIDYDSLWLRELWLLIQGKGILSSVASKGSVYVSFHVSDKIVTLDLKRLLESGNESLTETKNAFYNLLNIMKESETGADTEALEGVDGLTEEQIRNTSTDLSSLLNQRLREGRMSPNEQAKLLKLAEQANDITLINGETIGEYSKTKMSDYEMEKSKPARVNGKIVTEHEASSTIDAFSKTYLNKVMDKHLSAVALGFTDKGYILKDFDIDESVDALNHSRTIKLTLLPIDGKETTFELPVPFIDPESSTYIADGISYSQDAQRIDAPIRKTAPNKVALTSYYGKVFFHRSERVRDDWAHWLSSNIQSISLDSSDRRVTSIKRHMSVRPDITLPRTYTSLGKTIKSFKSNGIEFYFDYYNLGEFFTESEVKSFKNGKRYAVGKKDGKLVYLGMDELLYSGGETIGTMASHIGLESRQPTDVAMVKVYGKEIPMAFMLGKYLGWKNLVKLTKATIVEFPANTRDRKPSSDWVELVFKDKRIFVKKDNPVASMIFAGFATIKDQLSIYKVSDLEKETNYTPMLLDMGYSPIIAKEFNVMKNYFIDPMTSDALIAMKEPNKWIPLLERVAELLTTDEYPDETDPSHQRIRGYERIPGMLYSKIVAAVRSHENSPSRSSSKLVVDKFCLWKGLTEDPSTQLVQESNPVHRIKERSAITLGGTGGRSSRTLVMKSRVFDEKDVGIISEATPDSAKVAIRTFATPNAGITSTLGFMEQRDVSKLNATDMISATANLLPASNHDDMKRVVLSDVQYSSIVPTKGYMASPYSTGYDRVMGSRVGSKFVFVAKANGKVVKAKGNLSVLYSDGEKEGVKLGIWHGEVAGNSVSHTMITDYSEGDSFKEGDVLAWNHGFFERDFIDSKNVVMKLGAMSFVALVEGNDVLEDGCAISTELAESLTTQITKRKTLLLDFGKNIDILKNVGDKVNYDDIIANISNYIEGIEDTEASLQALEKFSGSNPTAGSSGTITGMELIYMGEKADMAPKLRELADRFDKLKAKDKRELGGVRSGNCRVNNSVFFGGERVVEDTLAISIFIDEESPMIIGDKKVFGNQLKSVVGRIMTGVNETESGLKLGARFGTRSVFARIVESPMIIGGYSRIIHWGSNEFVRLARGG